MQAPRLLPLLLLSLVPAEAAPPQAYVTELGRRVLSRSDQIVEGRVLSTQPPFRGISSARIRVTRRILGYDSSAEILVLFTEDFTAPDALGARYDREERIAKPRPGGAAGSAARGPVERRESPTETAGGSDEPTGHRFAGGDEGVFFLRRQSQTYALHAALSRLDPLYETKKGRLLETLALEDEPLLPAKVQKARDLHVAALSSDNLWLRGNSARELESLGRRFPDAFGEAERTALERRAAEESDAIIRTALERTLRRIDPARGALVASEAEAREAKRLDERLRKESDALSAIRDENLRAAEVARVGEVLGIGATALLARCLEDRAAVVREAAARALGSAGGPSAAEPLARALRRERDPDARRAMVDAAGALPSEPAVPLLAELLRDPTERVAALEALGRIPAEPARNALREARRGADPETAARIDELLATGGAEGS